MRPVSVRLVLVAVCLTVAGCGGDSKKAASTDPAPRPATVQQLAENCKQMVAAYHVAEGYSERLYRFCQKAVSGGAQHVRETTRDLCLQLVHKTLTGPEREQQGSNCQSWLVP